MFFSQIEYYNSRNPFTIIFHPIYILCIAEIFLFLSLILLLLLFLSTINACHLQLICIVYPPFNL